MSTISTEPQSNDGEQFVELFQQVIDGLPEQIALVSEDWIILAVNPAWTRAAALYGYEALSPGTDYLDFCEARARDGHAAAGMTVDGIRNMIRKGEPSFRFVYQGKDRWEGFAFQLCVSRIKLAGRTMYTVTRYDVTELVNLRLLRQEHSQSVIEHQAEERRRIAREVHDSTMQLLVGLGLSLGQLKLSERPEVPTGLVHEMEDLLGKVERELRTISYLAHPPALAKLGLARSVEELVAGFGRRTGLAIELDLESELPVSLEAQVAVYRMVQEALSNVHRHAHATGVKVGLYMRRGILHAVVADNGVGMPSHFDRGVGLASMSSRMSELGGRLTVRSGSPGTVLVATVPAQPELRATGDLARRV